MAKSYLDRQAERNKKRGRRSQIFGYPGHQRYKDTLINDVVDTAIGAATGEGLRRARNLPAVKPPSRPRVRTVSAGNMRSSRAVTRSMDRLSKGRSKKR